jgi:cell wall-associated NlpC family hydrolase
VLAQATQYRGAFVGARTVLAWALAHVGRFSYSLGPPTDRGGSVQEMQRREPAGSTCDCSMFMRWAFAQAGIDVGLTTSAQWAANGLLPSGDTAQRTALVTRGVASVPPPGGYQPADLIFFGVDDGPSGHIAGRVRQGGVRGWARHARVTVQGVVCVGVTSGGTAGSDADDG